MSTVNFTNLLVEGISGNKLIVVDIQPAYEKYFKYFKSKFLQDLVEFKGKVLYFYNGPDMGYNDDEYAIEQWIREETDEWDADLSNIEFVEKGYGFFRDVMDEGMGTDDIVTLIKYMLKNRVHDSRDINWDNWDDDEIDLQSEMEAGDVVVGLPSFDYKVLNKYKGASICGGGKDECLAEVQILLDAMNIKTKEVRKYIY